MITARTICLWILLVLAGGCSLISEPFPHFETDNLPRKSFVYGVPFFAQDDHQCGPAALAMVLCWSGLNVTAQDLKPEVYTPGRKGSLQPDMIGAARRKGRLAYEIKGIQVLLKELAHGHPVLILQNLGLRFYPQWHYAVAVGYDLNKAMIVLRSGQEPCKTQSLRTLKNTWKRSDFWALLVLPPEELPATVDKKSYLQALAGLEEAGSLQAAAKGYRRALSRWPDSIFFLVGLGNCLYKTGDLAGAQKVLQKAVKSHPDSAAAHNNLAHVLLKLGEYNQAYQYARKALDLGGPHTDTYLQTLREIEDHLPAKAN